MIHYLMVLLDYEFKPPSCYCQLVSLSTQIDLSFSFYLLSKNTH